MKYINKSSEFSDANSIPLNKEVLVHGSTPGVVMTFIV